MYGRIEYMNELVCSETDCTQKVKARGLCGKHHQRVRRKGKLSSLPPARNRWDGVTVEDRFWSKVDKNGLTPAHRPELGPCWMWTGGKMTSGYGLFYLNGTWTGAHRFSYELANDPIPDGMDLDHLCHPGDGSCAEDKKCPHRLCVNPVHLEPVIRLENLERGNTFVARNRAVTCCPQGHEYTPENTRIRIAASGNGSRHCKKCRA